MKIFPGNEYIVNMQMTRVRIVSFVVLVLGVRPHTPCGEMMSSVVR